MRLSPLCCILTALMGGAASAEDPPSPPEDLFDLLNTPVEVSSRRKLRAVDSPQAVEVFTAEWLRTLGVFRLADVLALATGAQVLPLGRQRTAISLRGVAQGGLPRTVQVLLDGAPLYNAGINALDLEILPVPLDLIDHIEVVRGPSSTLYGANAQLGVIAITTRRARHEMEGGLRTAIAAPRATQHQAFLSVGGDWGGVVAGVAGHAFGSRGWAPHVVGTPLTVPMDDSGHGLQAYLRSEFLTGLGTFWCSAGTGGRKLGPEQTIQPVTGQPLTLNTSQETELHLVQLGWSRRWSPALQAEARLGEVHTRRAYGAVLAADPQDPVSQSAYQLTLALEPRLASGLTYLDAASREAQVQVRLEPTPGLHLLLGADGRLLQVQPSKVVGLPRHERIWSRGAQVSTDLERAGFLFSTGLRWENDRLGGPRTSPRAVLVWRLGPAESLRIGYQTATRSPQTIEQLIDVRTFARVLVPNPDLRPEVARSLEVGWRRPLGAWALDLTAYRMDLRDLITRVTLDQFEVVNGAPVPVTQSRNGMNQRTQGLEAACSGELVPGWNGGLGASWVDYPDEARQAQADYAPRYGTTAWVRCRKGLFSGFLAVRQGAPFTISSVVGTTVRREELSPGLQVQCHAGWDLRPGFRLSAYALRASSAQFPAMNGANNSPFLVYHDGREAGLQATWRF